MEFKMLVVFHRSPRTAPGEAVLDEKLIAEVVLVDLVFEVLLAIAIRLGCGRLNDLLTILASPYIRIVKRVDVNGQPSGMVGKMLAA